MAEGGPGEAPDLMQELRANEELRAMQQALDDLAARRMTLYADLAQGKMDETEARAQIVEIEAQIAAMRHSSAFRSGSDLQTQAIKLSERE